MNTDKLNADFMDVVEIALSNVQDENARFQIIAITREFKEHLDEIRV
ncbi:MAG: hypothetical protein ACE3JK_14095 [Sporolactobacillus sp.]